MGYIKEIVRRGRVRGFTPSLITQRPAVVRKDVLSQADRQEGRRTLAALPQLRRGEGYL